MNPNIFKAYDIRGIYPSEINERDAYKIAQAFAAVIKPKTVALGKDIRLSSPKMWEAAKEGLLKAGVNVVDINTISTDMLYFAVGHYGFDGGITITASHNPKEYNGMKLVERESSPIYEGNKLPEIKEMASKKGFSLKKKPGNLTQKDILADYGAKVRSFSKLDNLRPQKIAINANFGLAGKFIQEILKNAPIEWVELNCEPDGNFPKGRPDPLVPENRDEMKKTVAESGADLGFSWDADADRCFIYEKGGKDIEGCYLGALLAKIMLDRPENKGKKVVYDPRIVWTVKETIEKYGGAAVPSRVGHAIIKAKMREIDAFMAVESSGHFYFADYFYCDNGLIPAILVIVYLNERKMALTEALAEITENYFVSGEINFQAENKDEILKKLKKKYGDAKFEEIDGLSIEYPNWRFNVRKSNTEPLLRLNIETRSQKLLEDKKEELVGLINQWKD
ncbi:MAG: phosphomannomutase/phosphoglucomutase [Candidatus Moranbacteria bacterium]|nr:phosphomannomutase/phosphoglucomutase [Candidatus Moranbacteria bacterium]